VPTAEAAPDGTRAVAVVGAGVVSCGAVGVGEYDHHIFGAGSDATPIDRFDTAPYACAVAFQAPETGLDVEQLARRHEALCEELGTQRPTFGQLAATGFTMLAHGVEQVASHDRHDSALLRGRGGTFLGTCGSLSPPVEDAIRREGTAGGRALYGEAPPVVMPALTWRLLTDAPFPEDLSLCNTACSSSLEGLVRAYHAIRIGALDWAVVGGVDVLAESVHAGFDLSRVLALGRPRPFDRAREGMQLGEGAAVVVLAAAETAPADHLGFVTSGGIALDGHHLTAPHPTGRGLRRAIDACGPAARGPLGGIVAHGTGTVHNDPAEAAAYHAHLDEHGDGPPVPIASLKSRIGHTLGAAGLHNVIAGLLALRRGHLPGTRNLVDPIVGPRLSASPDPQPLGDGAVLCAAAAFGGHNAAVTLERAA
jgi:3-oxoacyl-(acyl-carrier-protein) synthase